jgi:murein DD-endopeptidase MepM/ murein hydrolase activator NlpD
MVTKHGIDRRNFLQQAVVLGTSLSLPQMELDSSQGEYDISLGTWPHRIYKENDGLLEPATTESFVFNLLVKENQNRPLDPLRARLEFYTAEDKVHVLELSRKALDAIRGVSIATREPPDREDEVFDLRHHFSLPISLSADRLVYELVLIQAGGREVRRKLEIPLLRYEQKTKLIFPVKGKFITGFGHDFNEPHSNGRSQHFAYDILGTGPHWEVTRNGGAANPDIYTWGREVIAPADAIVIDARNDVPDQTVHGVIDPRLFENVPNPPEVSGNHVTLDHGNGEYSNVGHLQRSSVRVKTGDRVKQAEILGLVGNAGASPFPHLHYQFTASAKLAFFADGLPSRFENVSFDLFGKPIKIATPKRGLFLEAH